MSEMANVLKTDDARSSALKSKERLERPADNISLNTKCSSSEKTFRLAALWLLIRRDVNRATQNVRRDAQDVL
jgi:hypothetical protein